MFVRARPSTGPATARARSAPAARIAAVPDGTYDNEVTLPVQINGKRRGEVVAPKGADSKAVEALALADASVSVHLAGLTVRKVIVVQDRIINIVAN